VLTLLRALSDSSPEARKLLDAIHERIDELDDLDRFRSF